jgi:hypothetical protein
MTEMIEPVPRGGQQQELAQRLVEQAHAEGVELIGPGRLLPGLTKTVLETALQAEITGHLGYDKHDPAGRDRGNSRNGTRPKTVLTGVGPVEIDVLRQRDGSFTPAIVRKRRRRLDGIDQIVLSGRPRRADREASASAHDGRPPADARRPVAGPSHRAGRRDQHEGLGHPELLQQTRWSSHGGRAFLRHVEDERQESGTLRASRRGANDGVGRRRESVYCARNPGRWREGALVGLRSVR